MKRIGDRAWFKWSRRVATQFGVFILLAAGCSGAPQQEIGKPAHHLDNGEFRNPPGSPIENATFSDMAAFMWRRFGDEPPVVEAGHVLPQAEALAKFVELANENTLTWLGHAAFLLRIDGKIVLTDPYLSRVAGPLGFGPERYVDPGISIEQLPPIDYVLVSHNHYDHLDAETIEALPGKDRIHVIVPLQLGNFFRERGYTNVHELDWYDAIAFDKLKFQVLPAIHFSRRGPFDRNRTLWSGFAIRGAGLSVFHSGDTGYGAVFAEIGKRAGPFDLALVAIGAYEPRRIMKPAHVTPEEAVQLVNDIHSESAVGMHWGTVRLTDEAPFEPGRRFVEAAKDAGWRDGRAQIMSIGETRKLSEFQVASPVVQ